LYDIERERLDLFFACLFGRFERAALACIRLMLAFCLRWRIDIDVVEFTSRIPRMECMYA
jgi:hypothetical protein